MEKYSVLAKQVTETMFADYCDKHVKVTNEQAKHFGATGIVVGFGYKTQFKNDKFIGYKFRVFFVCDKTGKKLSAYTHHSSY